MIINKTLESPFPRRIICLTEESVETLFLLEKEQLIVGISAFVCRPERAKKIKRVSSFTSANIQKILDLNPDLILGFSDIQQDIAKELIAKGLNVFITNQRSLCEILDYIQMLGNLVGKREKAFQLVNHYKSKIEEIKSSYTKYTFRFYLEEWDDPKISGIRWFSEIFEAFGGVNIFKEKSRQKLAKERFATDEEIIENNPQIILASWCGKKVDMKSIYNRPGYDKIDAIKNNNVFELDPAIFLQPGPALFIDGLNIAEKIIKGLIKTL